MNSWTLPLYPILALLLLGSCGDAPATDPGGAREKFVFDNPLRDAVPDEWARYRLHGEFTWTQIYKSTDPGTVAYRIIEETRDPETNTLEDRQSRTLHPNSFLRGYDTAGMVITTLFEDRIFVAGREWDCLCVEFVGRIRGRVRCWFSADVPVNGLVKQATLMGDEPTVNVELVDWSTR